MSIFDWITDPLLLDFMRRALLVAVICGITCAVLSCWLTLMGWSLMGDAVSHAVLPGVVLSYLVGVPLAIGALIFGAGSVGLIGGLNRTSRVKEDAAMGIVFTGLFAIGLVLVSVIPSQIDLFHILFGSVLGVGDSDLISVVVIGVVVTAALLLRRRDLVLFAFDPTHAHAIGLSTRRLELLLLGALALTVVVALQAVGVLLVVAMLITRARPPTCSPIASTACSSSPSPAASSPASSAPTRASTSTPPPAARSSPSSPSNSSSPTP